MRGVMKGGKAMSIEENIKRIKGILEECTFGDPADRKYWEDRLRDLEARAKAAEENDRYFRAMKKYDRL